MSEAYLAAADVALGLLSRPEVARRWAEQSALEEWSVGGLAAHLASEISMVPRLLDRPVAEQLPITLPEHYTRVPWAREPVDSEVHTAIRRGGDEAAAVGPERLVAATVEARARVAELLADEPGDRPVFIPWQGWALRLDDFLVTRMMEIAVHTDDLAVSADVEPPRFPADVVRPVLALLTEVAVDRHGPTAVLRALSRAERAPSSIAAF
jgi:hypothetical protein